MRGLVFAAALSLLAGAGCADSQLSALTSRPQPNPPASNPPASNSPSSNRPPSDRPAWPDTFATRVEALAVLETLNAELLSHDSATATLEHWCDEHKLAVLARVTALRVTGADKPASIEQRRDLQVSESEPLRYRRVRLSCGTVTLSEADNWYVPARLTAEMNRQLETSDTPFGRVVQPLRFQRHTLTANLLWNPLPVGWEMQAAAPATATAPPRRDTALAIPPEVLQHRAVLSLPDGTPFSEVIETYTNGVFSFSQGTLQSSPN